MQKQILEKRKLHLLLVELQTGPATMEIILKMLKINLPHDLAMLLLDRCPKDSASDSTDMWSAMFTDALFTIARK